MSGTDNGLYADLALTSSSSDISKQVDTDYPAARPRQGMGRVTRFLPSYRFGRHVRCQAVPARRTPSGIGCCSIVSYLNY